MRTFVDARFKQLGEFFKKMERRDKIRLAVLILAVIILAIVVVAIVSRPVYETLISAESAAQAGEIKTSLQEMGEDFRIEGTRVLVREGRASELRADLASQGVLESEDLDYSIMAGASDFAVTESYAKKLYDAQAADNISIQLLKSDVIQNAVVTVTLGEYSPFVVSGGVKDATAAVMLTLRGGATLTDSEAQAIADLVRGNVPGIKDENISIMDENLNNYPVGDVSADISTEMSTRIDLENRLELQMQQQGEQLLTPIYGKSNVNITANVELNFDRRTTESVEFFPPIAGETDGIIRSSSELYENQRDAAAAEGAVGTDANGLGTVEYPYGTLEDGDEYRKSLIENNYEINETRESIEHEQGQVTSASISVLINSEAVTEDYTEEVRNLVSTAVGVPVDSITVVQTPFLYSEADELQAMRDEQDRLAAQERQRELLQMIIMWAVILLLGIAFISLIKAIVRAVKPPPPVIAEEAALAGGAVDYMADDNLEGMPPAQRYEDVELNAKPSGVEQIEKFIDKDPGAVAQLLRNWLTDE